MRAKKALNWIVVIAGALLGALGLAYFGLQNPTLATDPGRFSFIAASALFAVVPLLGSALAALNKRGLAAVLFLVVVPVFARWTFLNSEDTGLSHLYGGFGGICVVFGSYWLFVWWTHWPPFLYSRLTSRRLLVCIISLFVIAVFDLAATFVIVVLPSSSSVDCSPRPVFSRSTFGHDAVFTAHVIHVGHRVRVSDRWMGNWALAKVEERFWGWPFPRVVLLTAPGYGYGPLRSGEDYLVDGRRPTGAVTRFLPIVEIRWCGGRTARLADAALELRLLKSGFPKDDVRIMGRVDRWVRNTSEDLPQEYVLVPGAQVEITGPQGIITTTTDREGIYDVAGLPPGTYQARLRTSTGQERPMASMGFPSNLEAGQVAEYSFSFRQGSLRGN